MTLILFLFVMIGIILPHCFYGTVFILHMGKIHTASVFCVSTLGSLILWQWYNQDIATEFTRLFLVIGLSHLVYTAGQIQAYRRLNITRQLLQDALAKER